MDSELIPVTGTALIILFHAINDYFPNNGARTFCELLHKTGSWILGSFALMAVAEAAHWTPGDMDIFLDFNSQAIAGSLTILTEFLFRHGFRFVTDKASYGPRYEVLTFKHTERIMLGQFYSTKTRKVQLIVNKVSGSEPFPIHVLKKFDLSCCCCGFNGVFLYRAAWNIIPLFFTQHDKVKSFRVSKYRARGFTFDYDMGPEPVDHEEPESEVNGSIASEDPPHVPRDTAIPPDPEAKKESPEKCQVILKQKKVPCGRILVAGCCPIHS